MAKKKRWVIVGKVGLYVGQMQTRADAIADHVHNYRGIKACRRIFLNSRTVGVLTTTSVRHGRGENDKVTAAFARQSHIKGAFDEPAYRSLSASRS